MTPAQFQTNDLAGAEATARDRALSRRPRRGRRTNPRARPLATPFSSARHVAILPVAVLGLPTVAADAQPAPSNQESKIAETKYARLRGVLARVAAGATLYQAARAEGMAVSTAWKWNRKFQTHGIASLMPARKPRPPSHAERLGLSPDVLRAVEILAVKMGSTVRAWRTFAESPGCPERLRYLARAANIPEYLRAAVRFHVLRATVRLGREFCCLEIELPSPK